MSIKKLCEYFKVSRSGFYDYKNRKPSNRLIEDEILYEKINKIFFEHKRRYGAKRIKRCLLEENICVSRRRITRLMHKNQLVAKGCRYHYKKYNKENRVEKSNLINQIFKTKSKIKSKTIQKFFLSILNKV